jgi:hypothetical protein
MRNAAALALLSFFLLFSFLFFFFCVIRVAFNISSLCGYIDCFF